jgi:micrococcal nuclease
MPGRILILLALLLVLPLSAEAETLTGKVVGVTDGDTITVLVAERSVKVRLAEIDTPERGQPWAKRAKQALSDMVFGHEVEIRVVTVDRYGRTVGHVWLADRHINREMVSEGHARTGANMPNPKRSCQKTTYRRC